MEEQPGQARIRNAQDLLVFMDEGYPGTRELVLGALEPELRTVFETAPRTVWIPLEQDAVFVDAIVDRLGPGLASELWTRYTARFAHTPLMRALFDGATRLFGLSVGSYVRILPRIWTTAYRGAGQLDASEAGDNWRRVHITDMHPAMCELMLAGVSRFFRVLINLASAQFVLRKVPVIWNRIRRGPATLTSEVEDDGRVLIHYDDYIYSDDAVYRLLSIANCQGLVEAATKRVPRADVLRFDARSMTLEFWPLT